MLFAGIILAVSALVSALPAVPEVGTLAQCEEKLLPEGKQPGCEYNMTFMDDPRRNWLLFIPPNYSTKDPNPVIFSYHGGSRTPERQRDLDLLETSDFNTDHLVVYPRGIDARWEGTANITARDDVGYTNAILDELERDFLIDKNRLFITGKSNGGGFVNFAACHPQLSVRFAAFAPVSGSFYIEGARGCNPSTVPIPCDTGRDNLPIIEFHGGIDDTIRYNGDPDRRGACLPSIFHWVTEWALRDGLDAEPVTSPLTERAEILIWGEGPDKGLVTHVFEQDVGHSWPFTGDNDDNIENGDGPASYNATALIVDYFNQHPLQQ